MRKYCLYIVSLVLFNVAFGQRTVYQNSFDSLSSRYTRAKGIRGNCLDFTASASSRQPFIERDRLVHCKGNFTVMLWVKTPNTTIQPYTILAGNHSSNASKHSWQIGLQTGGAWNFKASISSATDTIQYDYLPTPKKQLINDNRWHQLAFSYDSMKNEFSFYYDGLNKAIIHTPGLKYFMTDELFVGGNPYGITDEWETFNGYIDELKIFDSVLPAAFVMKDYSSLMPNVKKENTIAAGTFSVMNYNILHGGRETGKEVGVQRIVDIIKTSGADIISMQETYGSGPAIADALGFYFYLRSSNLSIFSRYRIETSLPGGKPFNNGGVIVNMTGERKLAFYTNWLNYPFDYWDMLEKKLAIDSADWYHLQDSVNAQTIRNTLKTISPAIDNTENIPVIFCGDLNTGSHLDWTEATRHLNNGYVMPFPSTKLIQEKGFIDSYREIHPDPVKDRGITWSPMFLNAFKDRIDYIFYKSSKLKAVESKVINTHPARYPSDHGAVITKFIWVK